MPQGYQRSFVGQDEQLAVYDRVTGAWKRLHPRVVCFRNDFYKFSNPDGSANQEIERNYLANIDKAGIGAIRALHFGQMPSAEQMFNLAHFIVLQFTRTPAQRRLLAWADEQVIKSALEVEARQASISPETLPADFPISPSDLIGVNRAVKSGTIKIVSTNVTFLQTMISNALRFVDVILQFHWVFLRAPAETGFITSDDPFVITRPGSVRRDLPVGIATVGARKYFPLNRQTCLQIGDRGNGRTWHAIDSRDVRLINQSIAATANRFILGPEKSQLEVVIRRAAILAGGAHERHRTAEFRDASGIYHAFELLQSPSFGRW